MIMHEYSFSQAVSGKSMTDPIIIRVYTGVNIF